MELHVQNMTCGHCAGTVTKAVRNVDAQATVSVDVANRTVRIESQHPARDFVSAIEAAGYRSAVRD